MARRRQVANNEVEDKLARNRFERRVIVNGLIGTANVEAWVGRCRVEEGEKEENGKEEEEEEMSEQVCETLDEWMWI